MATSQVAWDALSAADTPCKRDPEAYHFNVNYTKSGYGIPEKTIKAAVRCRTKCPVLRECREVTKDFDKLNEVVGGKIYGRGSTLYKPNLEVEQRTLHIMNYINPSI